jgi:hypothetical protein
VKTTFDATFGRSEPDPPPDDEIRALRVAGARRCRNWTELDRDDLVERECGYLVSASTDDAFRLYTGDAFSRSGQIVSHLTPLYFHLTADGSDVVVLERQPRKWSDIVFEHERASR